MLKDLIIEKLKDKKVLILGYGKEGQSTFKLIRSLLPEQILTIADRNEKISKISETKLGDNKLNFLLGKDYINSINDFDIIVKSPGISIDNSNIKIDADKITSQSDLFIKAYSKKIIGITGTKGKSTTASLILNIFNDLIV